MDVEEQLFAMRKAAQGVLQTAQQSLEALNGAIEKQQSMTATLRNLAATTVREVGKEANAGVQAAIKEVAQVDIATQIKTAAQPTLDSIKAEAGTLNAATREAVAAASKLAGLRIDWVQKVTYFAVGAIAGMVFVVVYAMRPIQSMQQTLRSSIVVIEKPAAKPDLSPSGQHGHQGRSAGVKPIQPKPVPEEQP